MNLQRHQPTENRIACILCSCGQYTAIHILLFNGIELIQKRLNGLPLVITEIVDDNKETFLPFVKSWIKIGLEQIRTQRRPTFRLGKPSFIYTLNIFAKIIVRLCFLHLEHFQHTVVSRLQFHFPEKQLFLYFHPFLHGIGRGNHIANLHELHPIGSGGMLIDNIFLVDMFFQC